VSQAPLSLANYQPSSRPPGIEGLTTGEHAALESHPFPTPLRPPENLGLLSLDQTVELLRVAQDRLSLGDFTGALAIAEKVLSVAPHNESALRVATECQRTLMAMYVSRLGPLQGVPRVAVTPNDMRWLSIDHRAGFMLSLIDGKTSYDNLLQLSGMPTFDTLRLLHQLLEDQVISHKA
jgi:hypothetical protein